MIHIYISMNIKKTKIEFKEIESVKVFKYFDRHHTYEFGDIEIVIIKGLTLRIGKTYYVDKVRDTILNLIK